MTQRDRASIEQFTFTHSAGSRSPADVVVLRELRSRQRERSIYTPQRLDFHMLQFITEGEGTHWVDFETQRLTAGDVLLVRSGQVHAFDDSSSHEALLLLYQPDALDHAGHLITDIAAKMRETLHPTKADFAFLTSILGAQWTLDHAKGDLRADLMGPVLLRVVLGGLQALLAHEASRSNPAIARAREVVMSFEALVDGNFTRSRSLRWYASKLHMSERTVSRACAQLGRPTPKQLIDERAALEARRLLRVTTDSVEAIGHALGFTEATNFVKFFRRLVGHTPEAFRRSAE